MKKIITIILLILILPVIAFKIYFNKSKKDSLSITSPVNTLNIGSLLPHQEVNQFFSARFPDEPTFKEQSLPVPRSDKVLDYLEYEQSAQDNSFSVGLIQLPDKWLRYGSGIVLNQALKLVMTNSGNCELIGKDSKKFKGYPCLEYEYFKVEGDRCIETAGIIILKNNILYKIEITYPAEQHSECLDCVNQFIGNFTPN